MKVTASFATQGIYNIHHLRKFSRILFELLLKAGQESPNYSQTAHLFGTELYVLINVFNRMPCSDCQCQM